MTIRKAKLCQYFTAFVLVASVFGQPYRALAETNAKLSDDEIFYQKSYLLLSTGHYAELDQLYKQYLDLYADHKITAEELTKKFETFGKTSGLEPRYDDWVKTFPASYSAKLARGIYRTTTAWEKRGSGLAKNTSDAQFRGFEEMLIEARSDLEASLALNSRPVNSYRYLIRVAKGMGDEGRAIGGDILKALKTLDFKAIQAIYRNQKDSNAPSRGTKRELLDAALKLDPEALDVRFEYMDSITPKWGGSEELLARFFAESNQSPMSDKNKRIIEGKYYYSLGEEARFDKDFKTAAGNFYKYYLTTNNPANLELAGKTLLDGDFNDQAFERFDELVKDHPKYPYGYELRGYLYEIHFKDVTKAVKDYLAASELGASWSQNRMGWNYMMGINVPVDYVKAKQLLDLAAAQGNKTAKENLVILERILTQSVATAPANTIPPNH